MSYDRNYEEGGIFEKYSYEGGLTLTAIRARQAGERRRENAKKTNPFFEINIEIKDMKEKILDEEKCIKCHKNHIKNHERSIEELKEKLNDLNKECIKIHETCIEGLK